MTKEKFLRRLAGLKERLDTFEADESETMISEMSEFLYQGTSISQLLSAIKQDVEDFEFSSAMEKLESLIEQVEGGEEE